MNAAPDAGDVGLASRGPSVRLKTRGSDGWRHLRYLWQRPGLHHSELEAFGAVPLTSVPDCAGKSGCDPTAVAVFATRLALI